MNKINKNKIDQLLSEYIDGKLTDSENKEIELLLLHDLSAQQKLKELKKLKELLALKPKLPPDIGFWTRFEASLEKQKQEEQNLLPFRRKFVPVMSLVMAALVVVIGTIVIQNRMRFMQFFSEKSQAVREAYDKNKLQGQLLPLFSKVDKDKALQFSLFGTLAFDDKSKTELRIDEQSTKGYRIELGKDSNSIKKPVTFNHFVAEVKPTIKQKRLIDSMLELTSRRIESSVLIGENNVMAIAPDLPKINKMMVTNIAACLEPGQRVQFERLLEANDAPYTFSVNSRRLQKFDKIIQNIPRSPRDNHFVIITPDTMMYSQLHIDFDSLRRQMAENIHIFEQRRETLLQRMMTREFRQAPGGNVPHPPVPTFGKGEFLNIEINVPIEELEQQQQMRVIIQPRIRKRVFQPSVPSYSIELHESGDTSSTEPAQ